MPADNNEETNPIEQAATQDVFAALPTVEIDWAGIDPTPVTEGQPPSSVEYPKEIHGVIPENLIQMVLMAPMNKTIRTMLQSHTSKPIPDELTTAKGLFGWILENIASKPTPRNDNLEVQLRHTREASGRCTWHNSESGYQTLRYTPSDIQNLADENECESVEELQERIDEMAQQDCDSSDVDFEADGEEETSDHETTDSNDYNVHLVQNQRRRMDNLIVWLRNNLPDLLDNLDH